MMVRVYWPAEGRCREASRAKVRGTKRLSSPVANSQTRYQQCIHETFYAFFLHFQKFRFFWLFKCELRERFVHEPQAFRRHPWNTERSLEIAAKHMA